MKLSSLHLTFGIVIFTSMLFSCTTTSKKENIEFTDHYGNVMKSELRGYISDEKIDYYTDEIEVIFEAIRTSLNSYFVPASPSDYDIKIMPSFLNYTKTQVGNVNTTVEDIWGPLKQYVSTCSYKANLKYRIEIVDTEGNYVDNIMNEKDIFVNGTGTEPQQQGGSRSKWAEQKRYSIENAKKVIDNDILHKK